MEESFDLQHIQFPNKLNVTDQEIDISFLTESQQEFYLNLFQEIVVMYSAKKKPRVLVGFAGPTGSGKSVIAALFQQFSKQISLPLRFSVLGIDAFHYPNEYLELHTDTGGTKLRGVKGRYYTYDTAKLVSILKQFVAGEKVSLPSYSRITHDPIENVECIAEEKSLLLVEGLWLLFDKVGWEEIYSLLDYSILLMLIKMR